MRAPSGLRFVQLFAVGALIAGTWGCGSDEAEPNPQTPEPQAFTVLTYNVMCSFCGGGEYDSWDERQRYFADIFERHDADLIGLQELAFTSEVDQMRELLPGYEALYYAASDSPVTYPDASILYRASRYELLERGEYWLSPTPEVPSSTGFSEGRQLPRLVVWAKLLDRASERAVYFASTHVDNNFPSQQLSAPLILERMAPWVLDAPVVLLGDFNSKPDTEAYRLLIEGGLVNTQALAERWLVDTNESPAPSYDLDDRIDHIFVSHGDDFSVSEWRVDIHQYQTGPGAPLRYASDHFPMVATLRSTGR
ncbi:MAG: endonuclease/exonuclease/phosphatase family protein [Polyangiaceae bacterium]|nr:endonuclease/exonuclease/phosphatase family protein [Polyangiaceae bacterium]MCW5790634.1 endonuclease/exonuclease/phosphatase family protein [Polyangiaceae bacterium]